MQCVRRSVLCCFILSVFIFVPVSGEAAYEFSNVTEGSGFSYRGVPGDNNRITIPVFIDNHGLYSADITNNFYPDLLALGGESPVLFENRGGTFVKRKMFSDLRKKINGAVFVDYDVDGWQDLILIPMKGAPELYRNDRGTLRPAGAISEVQLEAGQGATVGDVNRDGCPDLFVVQSVSDFPSGSERRVTYRLGESQGQYDLSQKGNRNFLFVGTCSGFRLRESFPGGHRANSLVTSMADFTGNGWLDVHVANDFSRDSLFLNQGSGTFVHTLLPPSTNRNGMSSLVVDVDGNRFPDLFVSNITLSDTNPVFNQDYFRSVMTDKPFGNNLLVNDGTGSFRSLEGEYGLSGGGWGWSARSADFNNSGRREIIQARQNFIVRETPMQVFSLKDAEVVAYIRRLLEPGSSGGKPVENHLSSFAVDWLGYPAFWSQRGTDKSFRRQPDLEKRLGRWNARGLTPLDYDQDGRVDLALTNWSGPYGLLANRGSSTSAESNWVKVIFRTPNLYQGGTLRVQTSGRTQHIPLSTRTDYHSQQNRNYHIGLGSNSGVDRLEIRWTDGDTTGVKGVPSGSFVVVSDETVRVFDGLPD